MDKSKVSKKEFKSTSAHEAGHSATLDHPWELKNNAIQLTPSIDQSNTKTADENAIKKNVMNSAENPDPQYNSNGGSKMLPGQLRYMIQNIRERARHNPEQLKKADPEAEYKNNQGTNNN
jgi:hypothetical protein